MFEAELPTLYTPLHDLKNISPGSAQPAAWHSRLLQHEGVRREGHSTISPLPGLQQRSKQQMQRLDWIVIHRNVEKIADEGHQAAKIQVLQRSSNKYLLGHSMTMASSMESELRTDMDSDPKGPKSATCQKLAGIKCANENVEPACAFSGREYGHDRWPYS